MARTRSSQVLCPGIEDTADAPVTQDQRAVGDLEDLAQPVRDVDDRHALVGEGADETEEPLDLALGERRGRLVHDQDPRRRPQGLGDLHDLAFGHVEPAHALARIDIRSELGQPLPASACTACQSTNGIPASFRSGRAPSATFSPTLTSGTEFNSW